MLVRQVSAQTILPDEGLFKNYRLNKKGGNVLMTIEFSGQALSILKIAVC